jgi:5-formyltetrahydrofolate cyclo-ligase
MHEEKAQLRAELLTKRKTMQPDEAMRIATNIVAQLTNTADWEKVQRVHVYNAIAELGEVPTKPIVEWLKKEHQHIHIDFADTNPKAPFPTRRYDVIFVPVLGFDRGGFRLGMGGGWYDRWLKMQPQAHKIGLAYSWAELRNLPHEPHDVRLDQVLTG